MTPIERVQQIYAAFGRRDVPHILSGLASDVDWEHDTPPNPVPWLQPIKGRDRVPAFFEVLMSNVEITVFKPTQFFADGHNNTRCLH